MGSVWPKLNNAQCFIFLRWRLCWPTLNIHKWPPFVTYWASLHWQLCLPSPQCSILWRRGDRRTIQVKQCQLPFSQPAASSHQFLELSKLPTAHISVQIKESVKDAFCFWPKLSHLIAFWLFWCQCSLEWVWQYESPRKLINWREGEKRGWCWHTLEWRQMVCSKETWKYIEQTTSGGNSRFRCLGRLTQLLLHQLLTKVHFWYSRICENCAIWMKDWFSFAMNICRLKIRQSRIKA